MRQITTCVLVVAIAICAAADDGLVTRLNADPHGEETEVTAGRAAECSFDLPADHAQPVRLFVQAIMRYRALSNAGGLLRISVNGELITGEACINKPQSWQTHGVRAYVGNAFALLAQPGFDSSDRSDLGGLGFLFDITPFIRPGKNIVRFAHAAPTDAMLLRDATLILGDQTIPLVLTAVAPEANDPAALEWSFAPHIQEGRGLFISPGAPNRVSFLIRNTGEAVATSLALQLHLPADIGVRAVYIPYQDGWTDRTSVERTGTGAFTITLPAEAAAPSGMADYSTFGGHPLQVYLDCAAQPGVYALRWSSISQGGAGEEREAPLTVLPAVEESPQPRRCLLGTWAYRVVWVGVTETEKALQAQLRSQTDAYLAHCGISRLVLSEPDEIPPARENGMLVSLASPWGFNRTVYPHDTTDTAKARVDPQGRPIAADDRHATYLWCPTYAAANGAEVFGPITERIRDEGWDGFDLDHEGVHYQCFCDRCKAAFLGHAGLSADGLTWPNDVLADGPLHERWLRFHTHNTGLHVRGVREAVKAGNQDALLFSWFVASLYEHNPTGPHVETYRRRLAEEREIGYDIHDFMQHFDYANMANGVYPHDESTWEQPYGLTWAFNRVETMVDNPWSVPFAPCLNIGFGANSRDSWTSFEYLRWQAKTHIAQGVKGLDFWMLPFYDARHYTLFSELARIFSATEDIVWDGKRADEQVTVTGPDTIFSRAFIGHDRLLVAITNRGLEDAWVQIDVPENAADGRVLLADAPAADQLTIPALDGVFVVYQMR